jgi:hypothetical protein
LKELTALLVGRRSFELLAQLFAFDVSMLPAVDFAVSFSHAELTPVYNLSVNVVLNTEL